MSGGRMGVTDCHVHINPLWEMRPDAAGLLGHADAAGGRYLKDPGAFLEYLDTCGVERAVLVNYVAPEVIGYTEKTNEFVSDYVKANPERLIAVGGIRPDHPDPEREIGRLATSLGIRGIKLHPAHQLFRPNAYVDGEIPGLRALYAACEKHHLPVIFHTGTSVFPRARNKFSDPLFLRISHSTSRISRSSSRTAGGRYGWRPRRFSRDGFRTFGSRSPGFLRRGCSTTFLDSECSPTRCCSARTGPVPA